MLDVKTHPIERNLDYLKWGQFLGALGFLMPIFTLYMEFKFLTFAQFLTIQAIVPLSRVLFLFFFGHLGDKFPRRIFCMISAVLLTLSYVLLIFLEGYWIGVALFLWGIPPQRSHH